MLGEFNINILFPSEGFKKGSEARLSEAVTKLAAGVLTKYPNMRIGMSGSPPRASDFETSHSSGLYQMADLSFRPSMWMLQLRSLKKVYMEPLFGKSRCGYS